MTKIMVPRHRIPKASVLCPQCRKGARIVSSTSFADGYHRRHICGDNACGHSFYTLTPYDGRGEIKQSPLPFKDRPLSEAEVDTRLQWWLETEATPATPPEVTTIGNADPFIQRLADAMDREETERTTTERYIVTVINALKNKVAQLDQTKEVAND